MIALIQNELMKIFGKKTVIVYATLIILFVFIGALIFNKFHGFITEAVSPVVEVEVADQSDETSLTSEQATTEKSDPTTWEFMRYIVLDLVSFVTLFSVVVVSQNISSEFGDGTIKQLLIRPHPRWKILLSKFAAVNIYSLFLLSVLFISGYIIGLIFFKSGGFSNTIQLGGFGGFGFQEEIFETTIGKHFFQTVLYYLPGLLIINTISFMLSTLFKNQALAVGVGIFVLFINSTLSGIFTILIDRYEWFKYLIFPNLDLRVYTEGVYIEGMTAWFSLTILMIHFIAFMAITFTYFQRRDISF
ncbi:ABC transporter permease [Bacillus kwashiorkori]|uniref:ABC transporter permease n=1 Tax=Bacillus kwashiorkori TaxID=1522318 RepID=UPI000783BBDE|nr:ABC transporter permease [Bacillus kwashiorkori]